MGIRCLGFRSPRAVADLNDLLGNLLADIAINVNMPHVMQSTIAIESNSDTSMLDVQSSAQQFAWVEQAKSDLRRLMDFLCGLRWLRAGLKRGEQKKLFTTVRMILEKNADMAYRIMIQGPEVLDDSWPASARARFGDIWQQAMDAAHEERFLHWDVTFPNLWIQQWYAQNVLSPGLGEPGMIVLPEPGATEDGFDAIIGNPPWDRIKLQEKEWLEARAPDLALAPTAATRRAGLQTLRDQGDPLAMEFDKAKARSLNLGQHIRKSGQYPLLSKGDINLYALFVERGMTLTKPYSLVGLLTPSGLYADKTTSEFFRSVSTKGRVAGLFDFENRKIFFPDIDTRFKFCALICGGSARRFPSTSYAVYLHDVATLKDPSRCFSLTPEDFRRVNPNTGTAPIFRTRRDAEITRRMYEAHPVLVDRTQPEEHKVWPVRYTNMFHMTNDSHLFKSAQELHKKGFYPVGGNRRQKGEELYLPLYEGKMVQAFDHRAASVVVNPQNLKRPGQPQVATLEEHAIAEWVPQPRFWISENLHEGPEWNLAIKHVSSPTNVRTVIGALLPRAGCGNSLPVFLSEDQATTTVSRVDCYEVACLLCANFNAFSLDFVARQKLQGQNLNLYILEQLPMIAPDTYERTFGHTTARELVCDHVLQLTYTAFDMTPFARDLGYDGPPFDWDEEDRCHLQARLDALYFHLYGLSLEDAEYILETFLIVRREDEDEFGYYRTRDLILAYMNALAAGDTESRISA